MHKNDLTLIGSTDIFSGVVWRKMDEASLDLTKGKIQEMLDACYELAEGHCNGNRRQTDELVDRLINNWQRTGMVE
jgi:hypothetical protein